MKIRPTPGTAANIRLRLSMAQGHRHSRKRWQNIATFRCPGWVAGGAAGALTATPPTEDNYPKETFIHHQAGIDGRGGSSYIDGVVLRDRDGGRENWQAAASATRGDRLYYLQNWRADTVLTMRAAGQVVDRLAYTAYGEPIYLQNGIYDFADLVGGDGNPPRDGVTDGNDYNAFLNWHGADDPRADIVGGDGNPPGDGNVDGNDFSAYLNAYAASGPAYFSDSRRLYAGYEFDPVLGLAGASVYHVRNRVYDAENGRWTKRDPLGYVDGPSMYEYCRGMAMEARDASGLAVAYATLGDCSEYHFGLATIGRENNVACGLALRLALTSCCRLAVPTLLPASVAPFLDCIADANKAYRMCSTLPPPPPPPLAPGIPAPPCYANCATSTSFRSCFICCNQTCPSADTLDCQAYCSTKVRDFLPIGPRPRTRDRIEDGREVGPIFTRPGR